MEQPNSDKTEVPAEVPATVVATPAVTQEEDAVAKIARLEQEKAKVIEERDNYREGMLKAKSKNKNPELDDSEESEEDRIRRLINEETANSRIADIAREQDLFIKKLAQENKELKLAMTNKTTTSTPTSMGTHSESVAVKSTLITPEQLAAFKAKGWTDKDIERYKQNLQKKI